MGVPPPPPGKKDPGEKSLNNISLQAVTQASVCQVA